MQNRFMTIMSIIFIVFSSNIFSQTTILSDPLNWSTKGIQRGGSFTSDGYKPGFGNSHITYSVKTVTNGYVEFQVKGFKMSDYPKVSSSNLLDNSTFCVMYDGRGIKQPLRFYPNYRNNYFRWEIYYNGPHFTWPIGGDRFKAKMLMASPSRSASLPAGQPAIFYNKPGTTELDVDWKNEPTGMRASWDPNKWYTIRISWNNDTRDYKIERDGVEVWNIKKDMGQAFAGDHGHSSTSPIPRMPVDFKINLGSGPDDLKNYQPNLVFRNFKVVSTGGSSGPVNSLSVSPSSRSVSSAAGSASFSVSSNIGWSVSDNANWLTVSPTSGSNNNTLKATFTENTSTGSRTGTITTAGSGITRTVTVVQAGKSTSSNYLTLSPSSKSVSSAKGSTSFSVSSNVSWTANDNASWLTLVPASSSITANFTENSSTSSRKATVTVTGGGITRTATITQSGKSSTGGTYLNVPATLSLSKSSGTITVNVSSNVSWKVYDNTGSPGWIGKTPKTGNGNGKVIVSYMANNISRERKGDLIFEGGGLKKIVAIIQSGGSTTTSSLSLSPATNTVGASAGSRSLSISSNVSWTASDNASWLTLSPTSGSNNGSISANFTENTGSSSRSATVTLTGSGITRTATITQSGKSSNGDGKYITVPASLNIPKGSGTISVKVSSNVSWRVYDNTGRPGWLGKSPKIGTGNGVVAVRYFTNSSGIDRKGELIFEGGGIKEVVSVTQSGTSSSTGSGKYINVPEELTVGASSGLYEIIVSSNISWKVYDDTGTPGWIGKSPKTGTGDGVVKVRFLANTTGNPRTGNLFFEGAGITKIVKFNQSASSVLSKTNSESENGAIEAFEEIPTEFTVSNYPNPFNPSTTIKFTLPVAGHTELFIFNNLGQLVKKLVSEYKSAGSYNVTFNASKFSSGVYFYRLSSGDFSKTNKMILLE